jgi:hypothetical protein
VCDKKNHKKTTQRGIEIELNKTFFVAARFAKMILNCENVLHKKNCDRFF